MLNYCAIATGDRPILIRCAEHHASAAACCEFAEAKCEIATFYRSGRAMPAPTISTTHCAINWNLHSRSVTERRRAVTKRSALCTKCQRRLAAKLQFVTQQIREKKLSQIVCDSFSDLITAQRKRSTDGDPCPCARNGRYRQPERTGCHPCQYQH